jgi:hypothetical protein
VFLVTVREFFGEDIIMQHLNLKSLCLTVLLSLLAFGKAHAILITDVYLNDGNIITSQGLASPNSYLVIENYGETRRVPYPSHDGSAIVNQQGNYFDKVLNLQGDVGQWALRFDVTNTTPYIWSDYHFEFWNATFTSRLTNFPLVGYGFSIFSNDAFDGSILQFWEPNQQGIGVTNNFALTFVLEDVRSQFGNLVGIRQVATTAPEPNVLAVFGIGLGGFLFMRRRRSMRG